MPKVVGVRFRGIGKSYHFAPGELELLPGDVVLVNTSQGDSLGIVTDRICEIDENQLKAELKPVLRIATTEDEAIYEENGIREKEAYKICRQKIREHDLDMNLVDVECVFDRSRLIFYFTSEGRVDFRNLVRDLAQIFRIRIELRQIGVRDEARMVGGLGICGRPLCCTSFLNDFIPVSIKMAKEQGLSMNPGKLSGCCGRLMCCLKYEQAAYESIRKQMPKMGAVLQLQQGKYKVEAIDYLREKIACVAVENPEEKCILGVEEYQALLKNPKADLTEKIQQNSGESTLDEDVFDEEEKSVLAELEGIKSKTEIVIGDPDEFFVVEDKSKLAFSSTKVKENICCCQKQGHDGDGKCGGGCCSSQAQIEETVTEPTLHGQNLDALAENKQLYELPSWIDGEIILDEEEEKLSAAAKRQPSRSRQHSHTHQHRRRPHNVRNNQPTGGLRHEQSKMTDSDTEGRQRRRPRQNKRPNRSGEVRQKIDFTAESSESKPSLTKVQYRGNKGAEFNKRRNSQRRNRPFNKKENLS